MKNFILIAMSIGLFSMGQAQKINLGKATSAVTKGAQALLMKMLKGFQRNQ